MTFTERLSRMPEKVLEKMFVNYRDKPFSHKNRNILRLISHEQNWRVLDKHRVDVDLDLG